MPRREKLEEHISFNEDYITPPDILRAPTIPRGIAGFIVQKVCHGSESIPTYQRCLADTPFAGKLVSTEGHWMV